jgi:hypothetical protein
MDNALCYKVGLQLSCVVSRFHRVQFVRFVFQYLFLIVVHNACPRGGFFVSIVFLLTDSPTLSAPSLQTTSITLECRDDEKMKACCIL